MELCPICKSTDMIEVVKDESFICSSCGVLRTKFDYDSSQYSTSYARNYLKYATTEVNIPLNLSRLKLVSRWVFHGSSLLDVGCCVGEFIRFAEQHYKCVGFEPNGVAARAARRRVRSQILTSLNGHSGFKCVTLFDVLEHLQEPIEFLKHITTMLDSKGVVIVTTPDVSTVKDRTKIKEWKHYKPKEHLFLYTPGALSSLFASVGFKQIYEGREESAIRPGNENGDILTWVAQKK